MFTGIIQNLGKLEQRDQERFTFSADENVLTKLTSGTSIAINGICLTVIEKPKQKTFAVEIMPETERKTTMHYLQTSDLVNLELPATSETFLSGHIVQGHVDGVGVIKEIKQEGNSHLITIAISQTLTKYLVEKGSITVNGISLTVISVTEDTFTVGIIPHTWTHTMLHTTKSGDHVTIETDVLAKYVERLLQKGNND